VNILRYLLYMLGLMLGVTLFTAPVAAQDLPAATGNVWCGTANGPVNNPTGCTGYGDTASLKYAPFAALTAQANYPGGFSDTTATAGGLFQYSFEVVGGTAGKVVPLDVDALLRSFGDPSNNQESWARLIVTTDLGATAMIICTHAYPGGCGAGTDVQQWAGTLKIDATVGQGDSIYMDAEVWGGWGPNAGQAFASVDPFISIDPEFADANLYSIVQSAGVGNGVGTVPEPASWALMVGGFAMAGIALRRRSRSFGPA